MARKARVQLISSGMRDLLTDPGVVDDLERRGRNVAAQARSSAPVATGAYRDSIEVVTVRHDEGRPVVQVHATVPYALLIEARTQNLSRALDAGLD
jgi:hypothetical protein